MRPRTPRLPGHRVPGAPGVAEFDSVGAPDLPRAVSATGRASHPPGERPASPGRPGGIRPQSGMPVASVTFTRNLSSPFVASYVPAPLRWVRSSPRPGSTTAVPTGRPPRRQAGRGQRPVNARRAHAPAPALRPRAVASTTPWRAPRRRRVRRSGKYAALAPPATRTASGSRASMTCSSSSTSSALSSTTTVPGVRPTRSTGPRGRGARTPSTTSLPESSAHPSARSAPPSSNRACGRCSASATPGR